MEEKKFINEEIHQNGKRKLKKIGVILLSVGAVFAVVGIVLLILGFVNFASTVGPSSSFGMFAAGGFLLVLGIGLIAYGVYATFFAHARDILSYGASSVAPVASDTINYMTDKVSPSVNKAIGGLAESVADGIAKGKSQATKRKCGKCGSLNDQNAKFCTNCGAKFKIIRHCDACGYKIDENSKFCPNCGKEVAKD